MHITLTIIAHVDTMLMCYNSKHGDKMAMQFAFFEYMGETLFQPVNQEARDLLNKVRKIRKNLTEGEILYYAGLINDKQEIIIGPRIAFDKKLLDLVTYDGNGFLKNTDA